MLPRLDRLLLRSDHMAVLAEAPQVVWDVWAIREDMVHLVSAVAAEHTEPAVTLKDCGPNLPPVPGKLLTAPGLTIPRHRS